MTGKRKAGDDEVATLTGKRKSGDDDDATLPGKRGKLVTTMMLSPLQLPNSSQTTKTHVLNAINLQITRVGSERSVYVRFVAMKGRSLKWLGGATCVSKHKVLGSNS